MHKKKLLTFLLAILIVVIFLFFTFQNKSFASLIGDKNNAILKNSNKCVVMCQDSDGINTLEYEGRESINKIVEPLLDMRVRFSGYSGSTIDIPVNTTLYHLYFFDGEGNEFTFAYTENQKVYLNSKRYQIIMTESTAK